MMDFRAVSIIVPVFNEEDSIASTVEALLGGFPSAEIIVVDDGSTDGTLSRIQPFEGKVILLRHEFNRGYGAALKTGMRRASTNVLAWFDGDGQHKTSDLLQILEPIMKGQLEATLGQRVKGSAFSVRRAPGKFLLRMVSQIIARRRIPDLNCGLRAFKRQVIFRYLHLLPDGFSASATSTLLMFRRGYQTRFIPITTRQRAGGNSTVRILRDGFRTLGILMRMMLLFDAFIFFSFFAAIQIAPAFIYSIVQAHRHGQGIPVLGALVMISGVLTFAMGVISSQISEMRQERFEGADISLGKSI